MTSSSNQSDDELDILSGAVDLVRRRPDMYLGAVGGRRLGEVLVSRIILDISILKALPVEVDFVSGWWAICTDANWLEDYSLDFAAFKRFVPFPLAGDNAHRAELLVYAFANCVVVVKDEEEFWVKGERNKYGALPTTSGRYRLLFRADDDHAPHS